MKIFTVSEFIEDIVEREEGSTDHTRTTSDNEQEATNDDESDVEENSTMDANIT